MDERLEERLKTIRGVVLDLDGVLTDGSLILLPDGDQARVMNIRDGYAIQYVVKENIPLAVISSGTVSKGVEPRLRKLGVQDIRLGVEDKAQAFESFLSAYSLEAGDVLYTGDDMPDYSCMLKSGLACCPADAAAEIRMISHYVSPNNGGQGCVRDILEKLLRAQGKHWAQRL